jgi:hypothetical protein
VAPPTLFDSAEETLERLLEEAHDGRLQIPEFQREFVLEDEWIKSLLASVSLGHPIGALTLLETGSPDVRFDAWPIPGAPAPRAAPERLLVDGQQRITALYQVLASGRGAQARVGHEKPGQRWYYLDIRAALDPNADRDEAVISAPEARRVRTAQLEWEQRLFPLRLVFCDGGELRRWKRGFAEHGTPDGNEARGELMDRFETEVLKVVEGYAVPTITLAAETTRWAVRVHGGPEGRSLSDRFRAAALDGNARRTQERR